MWMQDEKCLKNYEYNLYDSKSNLQNDGNSLVERRLKTSGNISKNEAFSRNAFTMEVFPIFR